MKINWLTATYQPTTLFSLKPSWATSSGGKSLLLPTPYALRMALLDAAIRVEGVESAEITWNWIRSLEIGIQLPDQIVVTNIFARILRLKESKASGAKKEAAIAKAKADGNWPFQRTIGYREYVYHAAPLKLAFGFQKAKIGDELAFLLANVSCLGKRGGFMQLLSVPEQIEDDAGFVRLTADLTHFPLNGLMQLLDDCDPKTKFDQVNIYTTKKPKRFTRQIVLPYRMVQSSRSYSLYERV